MDNDSLDLIPTEELVAALARRAPDGCIVGMLERSSKVYDVVSSFSGANIPMRGLMAKLNDEFQEIIKDTEDPQEF